jgi:hypothetical protein
MTLAIILLGWIFSLCPCEFSRALVDRYSGDIMVREKGYLTFNPLKYPHPGFSIIQLAFWYIPVVSNLFWGSVHSFFSIQGVDWNPVAIGFERFRFWQL